MEAKLLTIKETAARLNVSPWTIRRWIYGKELGSVKLGRAIRVSMDEITRKIEAGTTKADHARV